MTPSKAKPPGSYRSHSDFKVIVLLVVALGCASVIVWLAMWLLPVLMIDEDAYVTSEGELDQAAIENAYNAVRVPIGVTSAAFLAAAAAIAGVWINVRTVAVARDSLAQTRSAEDERRRQWTEEQFSARFHDASTLLGAKDAAVRLAGVYSMARLGDEWSSQRQSCIDVLCAYARMPLEEFDKREREVRRAILDQVFRRLRVDSPNSWSDNSIDLTGAVIEDLKIAHPIRVRSLSLRDVTIGTFTFLDQVLLDEGHLDFSGATIRAELRILGVLEGHSSIWLTDVKITPDARMHVGVWQSEKARDAMPGFVRVNLNNLTIDGGQVTLSMRGYFAERSFFGHGVRVENATLLILMDEGEASDGAVALPMIEIAQDGHLKSSDRIRPHISLDEGLTEVLDCEVFDPDPRMSGWILSHLN